MRHTWTRTTAACLAALLGLPLAAGARHPAAPWLEPIPAAGRTSLVAALHQFMAAQSRQDWGAVYRLRPELDRETETEEQFVRRWKETAPDPVLDFVPENASPSNFAGVTRDEQVFDLLGCVQTEKGSTMGEKGSISAHWQDGTWYLDGVHVLNDDDDKPEPCRFHAERAVLAAAATRRH